MSGDIASGLMAMEGSHVINSRDRTLSEMIHKSAESYAHTKHQKKSERRRRSSER